MRKMTYRLSLSLAQFASLRGADIEYVESVAAQIQKKKFSTCFPRRAITSTVRGRDSFITGNAYRLSCSSVFGCSQLDNNDYIHSPSNRVGRLGRDVSRTSAQQSSCWILYSIENWNWDQVLIHSASELSAPTWLESSNKRGFNWCSKLGRRWCIYRRRRPRHSLHPEMPTMTNGINCLELKENDRRFGIRDVSQRRLFLRCHSWVRSLLVDRGLYIFFKKRKELYQKCC